MFKLNSVGKFMKRFKDVSLQLYRMNHPYSTESLAKIASNRRVAFQKQMNYRFEQVNPNLCRVHLPGLPYEAFDCYGKKVLPWKLLSLAESTDHAPSWNPADDTDPEGFAMIVTVYFRIEFNQEFYNIDSPKYPLFMDLSHDYLRRTSKCLVFHLRHADVKDPYAVMYSTDVKLDSETRKPTPYPAQWREFGIPTEPSKSLKHVFPERPDKNVFCTEHKIHYSDTDANHHANYTFYVRACYDSFHENITKQKYPESAGSLMQAGIKTLDVTYKQEAFMGDVMTVASWVDSKNSSIYYFELLKGNQIYCMVTFELFAADSQTKGRL